MWRWVGRTRYCLRVPAARPDPSRRWLCFHPHGGMFELAWYNRLIAPLAGYATVCTRCAGRRPVIRDNFYYLVAALAYKGDQCRLEKRYARAGTIECTAFYRKLVL